MGRRSETNAKALGSPASLGSQRQNEGAGTAQKFNADAKFRLTRRGAIAGLGGVAAAGFLGRPARASTTLRMWCFLDPLKGKSSREVALKTMIETFEAANPGVKIQVEPQNWQAMSEKFFAAHQTGTAPDIPTIIISRIYGAIKLGALANLDELFAKNWSQEDKDDIDGPIWRFGAKPDAHYQVPITATLYGMMYRADVLREAGIDPKSLSTWDKLIAAAQKLTKKDESGNVVRWGFGQPNTGLTPQPPILQNVLLDRDGNIFDKKFRAVWSTPAGVEGLKMQVDMMRKYKIMPESMLNMGNEEVHEQFLADRVAIMRATTARWLTVVARFGRGSVDYLPTPSFTEGKPSPSEITGWHIGVWSGSKNKELAGKFVEHMASKKADTLWTTVAGQLPFRKSTITDNAAFFADPNNAILLKAGEDMRRNGWLPPEGAGEGGWNEGFNAAFQDVMTNNTDPKVALQKAEAAFNRMRRR